MKFKKYWIVMFYWLINILKYQKLILAKLEKDKNIHDFLNYLNKYLFKLNPKIHNYIKFNKYFYNINSDKFIEKLYTTNYIYKSLNSKINFFFT